MPWFLHLALRQLFPPGKRFPAFATVSILGVALGVATLLVVQTVMNGFGEEHRNRIRESFGDCLVLSAQPIARPEELVAQLRRDREVTSATAFAEGPALARRGDFSGVAAVRGIDPTDPAQPARRYIHGGTFDDLDDGRVILGLGLAQQLRVRVGDKVELWSPVMAERAEKGKAPLPAEFEVCAILRTGFTEVDNTAALIPLRRFREIWHLGPRAHGIILRLRTPAQAEAVASRLNVGHPDLVFRPWQDIKRNFLEAIRFEKTMLFFLMFIITLVASFSIGSTLFSAVIRRSREVGVLAALGASQSRILALFGLQGLFIGALGTGLGFLLAWGILCFRDSILGAINAVFGDGDMVASVYQFARVPLHYDAMDFLAAGLFTLLVTTLAGLVPALWAASRKPSEAMRDA
ncbi:lipoprotein-releasing system protein LolC [Verrucomicrobiota bacterium]|nr:lipoprotein-releasing system transmembrane protein LolC [Verrucomicrobiota bacterium]GDY18379.1 lipoprotein-releasing system protein LolC [Verrucomicrobiota bacterium]